MENRLLIPAFVGKTQRWNFRVMPHIIGILSFSAVFFWEKKPIQLMMEL